jgi:hypothetical protein
MTHPTVPAGWPPPPGLDKEEPELGSEDDIPSDDTGQADEGEDQRRSQEGRERPAGD